MNTEKWQRLIKERLQILLKEFAQYGDVPPATVHRLEGLLEAGVLSGFLSRQETELMIKAVYQEEMGQSWQEDSVSIAQNDGVFRLPLRMARAPVWPTTKD